MGATLRSWGKQIKKHRVAILVVAILLIIAISLIIVGYRFDWTGFNGNNKSGKTLWDWLQLLIIPLALAVIAILFNLSERKNEQRVASDNQQETALQEYIKEMSELLLHGRLRESQPEDEVRTIARVRTLTILPRLDGKRKKSVLQFLHESGVIKQGKSYVNFRGADLSGADLKRANLIGVNLNGADLTGANMAGAFLGGAVLWEVNLIGVNLTGATLIGADLLGADLTGADLTGTDLKVITLTGATLTGANLKDASGITKEELEKQAKSLKGATMPDGSIHE